MPPPYQPFFRMKQIVHKSSYHAIRPCTFLTIDSIQPYALYALVLPSSHFLTCALKVPGVLKATLRHDLSILRLCQVSNTHLPIQSPCVACSFM